MLKDLEIINNGVVLNNGTIKTEKLDEVNSEKHETTEKFFSNDDAEIVIVELAAYNNTFKVETFKGEFIGYFTVVC